MGALTFVALLALHAHPDRPVLWLSPSGKIEVAGRPVDARITTGASQIPIPGGFGYDFTGVHGGILLDDIPELRLTGSMTISVWLNLRAYVDSGPGAQVLFRGDDRGGLDPYDLVIHSDGTIWFAIVNQENLGFGICGEIPLNHWTQVVASFDSNRSEMQLWIDRRRIAAAVTSRRPFENLDLAFAPGIGIGNVQNDRGPHNQPLDGVLADLRLYRGAYSPEDIDDGIPPWAREPSVRFGSP